MGVVTIDHTAARAALAEAGTATSRMLRTVSDPGLAVPGLDWTIRETAVHIATALAAFTSSAAGIAGVNPPSGPAQARERVARWNAARVSQAPNATSEELAARIDQEVSAFLHATANRPGGDRIPTPWYGEHQALDLDSATCLLLAEQLVHGYDLAKALHRPWRIQPAQARLAIHGPIAMMPVVVNPETTPRPACRPSMTRRSGGGPRFQVVIDRGTARTGTPSRRADCHVSAEPVAFLLLSFGRTSQWGLIAKGKMLAWGRKPWLGMSFKSLFLNP